MTDEPLFPLIDPIADLQATVTFDQSRQALALCMQFFLVNSATEFEQLRTLLSTLLEQQPLSESLQLLYRRIAQESSERLLFMDTAEKWAQAQDTEMRAVAIEPEQWRISLRAGADSTSVRAERGWDMETDEMTIIITTRDGEQVEY